MGDIMQADFTELAREALLNAEEAFADARRKLVARKSAEADSLLEELDGFLDKAVEHGREGDPDTAEAWIFEAKKCMRKLVGHQHQAEQREIDEAITAARAQMDGAVRAVEIAIEESAGTSLIDRALRRQPESANIPQDELRLARSARRFPALWAVAAIAAFAALIVFAREILR